MFSALDVEGQKKELRLLHSFHPITLVFGWPVLELAFTFIHG
jgi:hypothetical protein